MNQVCAWRASGWVLLAMALLAQGPHAGAQPPDSFKDEQLPVEELSGRDDAEMRKYTRGQESANTDAAKKTIDKAVRYFTYSLTRIEVQEGRSSSIGELFEKALGTSPFSNSVLFPPLRPAQSDDPEDVARRGRQVEYLSVLAPILTTHVEKVLDNRMIIARLNAVRYLDRLAEHGHDGGADLCVKVINRPIENDAVRYMAMRSLAKIFAKYEPTRQDNPVYKGKEGPARFEAATLAICKWLEDRMAVPAERVSQMDEEEKDGASAVRRAAIEALGAARRPLIVDEQSGAKRRLGPVAELLVRIMENQNVSPPAAMPERVDACLALMRLNPRYSPSYQPDFAAFQVARFLAQMGAEAATDTARDQQRWRHYAIQIKEALNLVQASAQGASPAAKYVLKVIAQLGPVLANLDDASENRQAPQELNRWLGENQPAAKTVYKPVSSE